MTRARTARVLQTVSDWTAYTSWVYSAVAAVAYLTHRVGFLTVVLLAVPFLVVGVGAGIAASVINPTDPEPEVQP